MSGLKGLNLGGDDGKPETPPSGPPENLEETKPESQKAEAEEIAAPAEVHFSSHPIMRYTLGEYQFENGLLVLRADEAENFRQLLAEIPRSESSRIRELDVSAAEAQVRAMLAVQGRATKSIDSSTGDRAPNNQVGTGTLESGGGA